MYTLFKKLISAIENKCLKEGVRFVKQEESYTSKASFIERDEMPVWSKGDKSTHRFSGSRVTRGAYLSNNGKQIHADINGSLNILRKSGVVALPTDLKIKDPIKIHIRKRKAMTLLNSFSKL